MTNQEIVKDLKPVVLWKYFSELSDIPRSSSNEAAVRNWLINFANQHVLSYKQDKAGNLVIYKNSQNSTSTKTVLLQAHMDMVCEKDENVVHDFLSDGIKFKLDGDFLFASGTTLGSDNGVGLCAILSVLADKKISHPKIVALFTVLEETGVNGALELDTSLISGDIILNLDSEEEGEVFIGCAGSRSVILEATFEKEKVNTRQKIYNIKIGGLAGGHSGVNISENRVNAIKLLATILKDISILGELNLESISGGNMRNAIPREAVAYFASGIEFRSLEVIVKSFVENFKDQEPDLAVIITELQNLETEVFSTQVSFRIINLINSIHSGVYNMSMAIEGLVQSSNNLGVVKTNGKCVSIINLARSSKKSDLANICGLLLSNFENFLQIKSTLNPALENIQLEQKDNYTLELDVQSPSWQPDPEMELLEIFQTTHSQLIGKKALVKAIHAGLEAGIIKTYLPGSQAISFGPQIQNAHSPKESVKISSVGLFYKILEDLLAKL